MADRQIRGSDDACAIPKWGPKGLRYEVDDFIVSPPSNEDGGFFHLRYGQRSKPRASTYDRINKELSMTVEIKDGDPMISNLNLSGLEEGFGTTSLNITPTGLTPTGLTPTKNPEPTPEPSSSHSTTKPLFVFHLKDSKPISIIEEHGEIDDSGGVSSSTADFEESMSQLALQQSEVFVPPVCDKEIPPVCDEEIPVERVNAEVGVKKGYPKQEAKLEVNLVEKVQNLTLASPVEGAPIFTSPKTTPFTTPINSPNTKRKISGVVMDQQSVKNSYFCTKPFQSSQESSSVSAFVSSNVTELSTTSAQMSEHLDSSQKMMGRKRKPKPSTLREMNFWAPTSM